MHGCDVSKHSCIGGLENRIQKEEITPDVENMRTTCADGQEKFKR